MHVRAHVRQREQVAAQQRLLAAERAAFALRQTAAGNVVSEVGRDPSCDGVDRRRGGAQVQRHVRLVDGVRHVEELVEELVWAVEEDPALLQQRLAGMPGRFDVERE